MRRRRSRSASRVASACENSSGSLGSARIADLAVRHRLGDRSGPGRHDWPRVGHGLQKNNAEPLLPARQTEDGGPAVPIRQLAARDGSQELDTALQGQIVSQPLPRTPARPVPHDPALEGHAGRAQPGVAPEQDADVFPRVQMGHGQDRRRILLHRAPRFPGGLPGAEVDQFRNHHHLGKGNPIGLRDPTPRVSAGGDHHIGTVHGQPLERRLDRQHPADEAPFVPKFVGNHALDAGNVGRGGPAPVVKPVQVETDHPVVPSGPEARRHLEVEQQALQGKAGCPETGRVGRDANLPVRQASRQLANTHVGSAPPRNREGGGGHERQIGGSGGADPPLFAGGLWGIPAWSKIARP